MNKDIIEFSSLQSILRYLFCFFLYFFYAHLCSKPSSGGRGFVQSSISVIYEARSSHQTPDDGDDAYDDDDGVYFEVEILSL